MWHAYRDMVEGRLILAGYPDPDAMPCRLFLPAVYAAITTNMDAKQLRAFEEWLHEPWLTDRQTWGDRVDSPATEEQRAMIENARARPREPRP